MTSELHILIAVLPGKPHWASDRGYVSGREIYECDALAATVSSQAGVRATVFEGTLGDAPEADFFLLFGAELERHRAALGDARPGWLPRVVLMNADRLEVLEHLEAYGLAGAVKFGRAASWQEPGRAMITACRDIVEGAGGEVAPNLPRINSSEHYVPWRHPDHPTLAALLVHYLRLLGAAAPRSEGS